MQTQPEKICNKFAKHKSVQCANDTDMCVADFLKLCLSPRTTSRTTPFSISNSFWYHSVLFFTEALAFQFRCCMYISSLSGV